jgi:PAS domain-containing protein
LVLEAAVRLLANPLFIRMAFGVALATGAFFLAIVAMRLLRRHMIESELPPNDLEKDGALYPFSAVIQQLKQQKFALQHEHQEQQRKAKNTEHVTAAVIASLPCGVLFIGANGLVRQANVAAKQILGFASPMGMNAEEIFRDARSVAEVGTWLRAADLLQNALRGHAHGGDVEFLYETPSGAARSLRLTTVQLRTPTGDSLGIAVIISDESAMARQRREELLRSETSAEMALELHTSLAIIRECASQISLTKDPDFARNLGKDIALEAERLSASVGGFLAKDREAETLAAKA